MQVAQGSVPGSTPGSCHLPAWKTRLGTTNTTERASVGWGLREVHPCIIIFPMKTWGRRAKHVQFMLPSRPRVSRLLPTMYTLEVRSPHSTINHTGRRAFLGSYCAMSSWRHKVYIQKIVKVKKYMRSIVLRINSGKGTTGEGHHLVWMGYPPTSCWFGISANGVWLSAWISKSHCKERAFNSKRY